MWPAATRPREQNLLPWCALVYFSFHSLLIANIDRLTHSNHQPGTVMDLGDTGTLFANPKLINISESIRN
ncbi:hypothetical protein RB195_012627 [Necator americanus]|uniref:Secreted protein n=1 Tax=Necator americanus TaxID=51031 RepID=A0ABR1DRU0_NECAM